MDARQQERLVAKQFETGDSKRFEVVGIKSTINPCPQSSLHNIVGAGCAPSEHNAAPSEANMSIVAGATWVTPVESDSTIN
jgi:hypothetical protein